MGKIQTFFTTLGKSFTSPQYYADIVRAPLSFSFKYYAVYTLLFSLIIAGFMSARWIAPFTDFLHTIPDHIVEAYPDELIVTINNGQVSTNVQEPYFIPTSSLQPLINEFEEKVLGTDENDIQNILVIDTQAEADDLKTYSTFALLTFDSVSYINDDGNIEIVSLEDIENVTINKDEVVSLLDSVRPYIRYVLPIVAAFIMLGFMFNGAFRLIYIFILAFFVWLIAKMASTPLSYGKAYQMGLHFNFIPYSILTLAGLFDLSVAIPFFETILQIAIAVLLIVTIKPLLASSKAKPTAQVVTAQ